MTILFVHIIASIFALLGSIWLLATAWRSKESTSQVKLIVTSAFTVGSIATGGILLLQGASVTRACVEGGALIVLNVGMILYVRNLPARRTIIVD